MEKLKYPIGKFVYQTGNAGLLASELDRIGALPVKVRQAVEGLSAVQLDTPYRDGGWTLRQVVHHLADSHINAYVRFKLTITEEQPVIRPYDEVAWAQCEDALSGDINLSLNLLEALHLRWTAFLRGVNEADFARTYYHPANKNVVTLTDAVSLYAWHGDHHLAHISTTCDRMGW